MDWASVLSDPADLRARGLFVAEGRRVLERLLAGAAGGPDAVIAVLATPAAATALRLEDRLPGRVDVRSPRAMEAVTGFNFHRGVLALARRPASRTPSDVIAALPVDTGRPLIVVAEHLVDVDNVGSCFRNARAFGATGVLLDARCADPLYRKAVRTSLGAVLEVPWAHAPITAIFDALEAAGVRTVGLTPHQGRLPTADARASLATPTGASLVAIDAPSAPMRDVVSRLAPTGPVALVVGNEADGLSESTLTRCTCLARIPMAAGADSLNVATALAIALYECRQER